MTSPLSSKGTEMPLPVWKGLQGEPGEQGHGQNVWDRGAGRSQEQASHTHLALARLPQSAHFKKKGG